MPKEIIYQQQKILTKTRDSEILDSFLLFNLCKWTQLEDILSDVIGKKVV